MLNSFVGIVAIAIVITTVHIAQAIPPIIETFTQLFR